MTEERGDRTLDSFVAAWTAPLPNPQFHSKVGRAFEREFVNRPWWRRWNGPSQWRVGKAVLGSAAIGAFLIVIGVAFPQTSRLALSWLQPSGTMNLEEISYSEDGTPHAHTYWKIGPIVDGSWSNLWTYSPDRPYDNMLRKASYVLIRMALAVPFVESIEQTSAEARRRAALANGGCIQGYETVLGQETVMGYPTTVLQDVLRPEVRVTTWLAPSLGCQELKRTVEERRPDGTYHLVSEKRPLAVAP